MASEDTFIWVDHLEDMVHAIRKLETFYESRLEELPDNHSDLEFDFPNQVDVLLYGPTNWRIGYDVQGEAWGLTIKGDDK